MTPVRHGTKSQLKRTIPVEAKDGEPRAQYSDFVRGTKVRDAIEFARPGFDSDDVILITGPTGSGKEGIARLIHDQSRPDATFLGVSVKEFQDSLQVSELFGYAKGSFTGAYSDRPGLFEAIDHGTLFLDEIGEATSDCQASLLRVLQERSIRRVGSTSRIPFRGRLIVATNRDLQHEVAKGMFRLDLFMRLSRWIVGLPSISEAPETVWPAFQRHVDYISAGKSIIWENEREIEAVLINHNWVGNYRDLENVAVVVARTALHNNVPITPELVSKKLPQWTSFQEPTDTSQHITGLRTLDETQREVIRQHLALARGNVAEASRTLRISDSTLRDKIKSLGINPAEFRNLSIPNTVTDSRMVSRLP
ncbi:MAG: sigma-54-dependent Fis family transcriptional regulator [Calditrichaeota bacterium]|nr:sigma-54-dependent Fis family transcriptional regulator [Calditrichota bacterium]